MTPTLIDIARDTKTSVSTVSRVLSGGAAAARISEQTRGRIVEAANRLGYRPNLVARSLRTRRSHTIALLISDIANPFFGQIASLIEQSLHRLGYSLMLCNSGEDAEREAEYLRLLPQKGLDGLIVVPVLRSKKAILDLLPPSLPLVILDRAIAGFDSVVATDQEQASNLLCDTLLRAGVRRIALVAGPQHIITHRRRAEVIADRLEVIARHEGPAQIETGRQAFIKFLHTQADAIVCTNNFLGQGVIDSIADVEHPAVIGCFDEIPEMHLLPIPLVCVVQDVPLLADGCVSQIMAQLKGDGKPIQPILLPARAITNRSFQTRQVHATPA